MAGIAKTKIIKSVNFSMYKIWTRKTQHKPRKNQIKECADLAGIVEIKIITNVKINILKKSKIHKRKPKVLTMTWNCLFPLSTSTQT